MSGALVPVGDLERMAQAVAASKLFGLQTKEQALALMLVAQAEGLHPATAARDYHIIQNRPAMKADAMLARYLNSGGSIEWHEHTDAKVAATFKHPQGGTLRIDWDMERAKKAGLGGKDNWSKYPRQMLRARVISEGVRATNPAVAIGVYTVEETQDFDAQRGRKIKDMGAAEIVPDESSAPQETPPSNAASVPASADAADLITLDDAMTLAADLRACDPQAEAAFLRIAKIAKLTELQALDMPEAQEWLKRRKEKAARK